MSDILTEPSGSVLRVQLNPPEKKNAMTSDMYLKARQGAVRRKSAS